MTPEEMMIYSGLIPLAAIKPTKPEWLWYPYIPLGKVTIIQGDPGEGKSTLAMHIAAAVTKGCDFPDLETVRHLPDCVIYANAEDGLSDTVRPRFDASGADIVMIVISRQDGELMNITDGRLEAQIRSAEPKLVILDPLQAFLGSDVDMHRANEVRPVMQHLAAMAEKYHCAILLIGHMNKRAGDKSMYRGLGSIDIAAAARSILLVARDPAVPENRVIFHVKSSLAPEGEPVAFSLTEQGFTWLGHYEADLTKLLSAERSRPDAELDRAKRCILGMMEQHGTVLAREMYEVADSEGISKPCLGRAKLMLHIQSKKTSEGWVWSR